MRKVKFDGAVRALELSRYFLVGFAEHDAFEDSMFCVCEPDAQEVAPLLMVQFRSPCRSLEQIRRITTMSIRLHSAWLAPRARRVPPGTGLSGRIVAQNHARRPTGDEAPDAGQCPLACPVLALRRDEEVVAERDPDAVRVRS